MSRVNISAVTPELSTLAVEVDNLIETYSSNPYVCAVQPGKPRRRRIVELARANGAPNIVVATLRAEFRDMTRINWRPQVFSWHSAE